MDPSLGRKAWRTLEPIHGFIYFAPEAAERFGALGLSGRAGYFASRSAPMGAVAAEVVIATFFNFHPGLVRRAMEGAWATASPEQVLAARLDAVDAGLRAALGDAVDGREVAEAAGLARQAAAACDPVGRPLFAGHASLPWPDAPHLQLWHAQSLLREHRGDGHIACLVHEGIGGCAALVLHGASGDVPLAVLQATRAWPDDEWQAEVERLRGDGLVDAETKLTDAGAALRHRYESRTDELAVAPYRALGEAGVERLRELCRPLAKAIVGSGAFGRPAPSDG